MIHETSAMAVIIFLFFAGFVLALSFYLGSRAKSASGYFAAGGHIPWFVNGIAFAGDYLSAASFLGICGMIAFLGYDGFLYSIGYLAGWIVALFVVAEPLKRLGRFTFADALDNKFNSRGIKLTAAISTLVVSIFYLIPQMVGAGALIQPLLGFPHYVGVLTVGTIVTLIVVMAGMVSTTWVQFIKGSLLVFLCLILTAMILHRGLWVGDKVHGEPFQRNVAVAAVIEAEGVQELPPDGEWVGKPYVRVKDAKGVVSVWRVDCSARVPKTKECIGIDKETDTLWETQTLTTLADGSRLANGLPRGKGEGEADLRPVGHLAKLPGDIQETGPLGPLEFFAKMQESDVILWSAEKKIKGADGSETVVYYQTLKKGNDILVPGSSPTFSKVRSEKWSDKLDFLSLMLALFLGTASLPHILIRYYTVKDQVSARKSTVVGIAAIGTFYILTLYLGLGAMSSGTLDPTDTNMAAPLMAKSFSPFLFAVLSAVAFTTVLGTVSGLIMAASGAVAHDLMTNFFKMKMDDARKVKSAKIAAACVGVIAMLLGILFAKMNVSFLVGWAFNVAASSNLPALAMLLFWKKTTKEGIASAIVVGMVSSLTWILLSAQAFQNVYGLDPAGAIVPFSQPAIVTIPLGFLVLVVVSLFTQPKAGTAAVKAA
jgi:cation/acetate symporter